MRKKFNDTGLCILEKHYMADTSANLAELIELVEDGSYFMINRPRQYGKTTILEVIELKRWEGEAYHQKGPQQLSYYLDIYGLRQGFLLIFDFRKKKTYKMESISFQDKHILAFWV